MFYFLVHFRIALTLVNWNTARARQGLDVFRTTVDAAFVGLHSFHLWQHSNSVKAAHCVLLRLCTDSNLSSEPEEHITCLHMLTHSQDTFMFKLACPLLFDPCLWVPTLTYPSSKLTSNNFPNTPKPPPPAKQFFFFFSIFCIIKQQKELSMN